MHPARGSGLLETILATFILALVIAAVLDCGIGAMDCNRRDYAMTEAQSICQRVMEDSLHGATTVAGWETLRSSQPGQSYVGSSQYQYIGDDHGNTMHWVYELDSNVVDDSPVAGVPSGCLKRLSVSLYLNDPSSSTPRPDPVLPLVERVSTMVFRP